MATNVKDVRINTEMSLKLLSDNHKRYLLSFQTKKDNPEHILSDYLRLNAICWNITALELLKSSDSLGAVELIDFLQQCSNDDGGYGPSIGFCSHVHSTLCAIQIAIYLDSVHLIDFEKTGRFVASLQQSDGSFHGDTFGECDTRLCLCAIASLYLMDRLDTIDKTITLNYVMRCMNFDGGFGAEPTAESHSGQIYCCVAILAILKSLNLLPIEKLAWWLSERQLPSGGLNGRPEKLPDVCYSWWVLSSLTIIRKSSWIDKKELANFIMHCQDMEEGGFADRPGDVADIYHTLFAICGLSLLGVTRSDEFEIAAVNPIFCMPVHILNRFRPEANKLY